MRRAQGEESAMLVAIPCAEAIALVIGGPQARV